MKNYTVPSIEGWNYWVKIMNGDSQPSNKE